jgi:hypothetical protein
MLALSKESTNLQNSESKKEVQTQTKDKSQTSIEESPPK